MFYGLPASLSLPLNLNCRLCLVSLLCSVQLCLPGLPPIGIQHSYKLQHTPTQPTLHIVCALSVLQRGKTTREGGNFRLVLLCLLACPIARSLARSPLRPPAKLSLPCPRPTTTTTPTCNPTANKLKRAG
ncbi:hypothetical protein F5Y07DRAFT_327747 [Xylaria sp. FL0933]|nr:hypothetical protein F5Y07DRAFT_327747 [Xylaria sp. FL0933]